MSSSTPHWLEMNKKKFVFRIIFTITKVILIAAICISITLSLYTIDKNNLTEYEINSLRTDMSNNLNNINQIVDRLEKQRIKNSELKSDIVSLTQKLNKLEEDFIYNFGGLPIDDIESVKINIMDMEKLLDEMKTKQNEQDNSIKELLNKSKSFSDNLNKSPQTNTKTKAKAVTKPKFPYQLVNIEYRAGQLWAVIAARDSSRIEQLILVAVGDTVNNWRLIKLDLDKKTVTFSKGDVIQTLKIG